MSGIIGIVHLDKSPVDRQQLERMTQFMAFRGPDAQDIWIHNHVGFGHTMLRTTDESLREHQPFSLDGQIWIVADARVDGRADLIRELTSGGCSDLKVATDIDLILHAYKVWGEDCVKHLLGDFSFAIWDERKEGLFCARDHLGVKPFYYARMGTRLIFSNTLNCIRLHPAVSDELNELAIADYLLLGSNQDPAATFFLDVQRLPPGHFLTWRDGTSRKIRYWTVPIDAPIRYKCPEDYVDHFADLLHLTINDRLRTNHVATFMSGGIDSTAMAAAAVRLLNKDFCDSRLRAYAIVYDRLIRDEERHYSGLAAKALGIPIRYLVADDNRLIGRWDQLQFNTPEPIDDPLSLALSFYVFREISSNSRVALYGEGPDNLLTFECRPYVFDLIKKLRVKRLISDASSYVLVQGQLTSLPRIFRRLKRLFTNHRAKSSSLEERSFPLWLRQDFISRIGLSERLEQINRPSARTHPIRPRAYDSITSPLWQSVFESSDPGVTSFPVEVRLPYIDIRMVRYLLAVPPIPWCCRKYLLRCFLKGLVPEEVRLRPKAPLSGYPIIELLHRGNARWIDQFELNSDLTKYIKRGINPNVSAKQISDELWMSLRLINLNYWMKNKACLNFMRKQE